MSENEKINYVELPAKDLKLAKTFFKAVFEWDFVDYGPEYMAFSNSGLNGGFYQSEKAVSTQNGSALIVFYSSNLEAIQTKIVKNGGRIVKPIFSFPGGRRFHFSDTNGNEFAVWSDLQPNLQSV